MILRLPTTAICWKKPRTIFASWSKKEQNIVPSNLTDDERAVLMIAADNQSMIPIGRWQKPIENLSFLGLLRKLDAVNYIITDNGRKMLADRQHEEDAEFQHAFAQITDDRNAREQSMMSLNQAAQHLVYAAKAAAKISGTQPEKEVWTIGQSVVARALELLK
jgi:hypothetical protein